jgi:cytochrome c oxidase subunit 4
MSSSTHPTIAHPVGHPQHKLGNDEEHDDGTLHIHAGDLKLYIGIFCALIFFTVLTVGVSYIHLGPLNLVVAIAIATVKASLVVTFFMHLKDDKRFITLMLLGGVFFIGIFFSYTMMDTDRRQNELNDASGNHVFLGESEKQAPGGFVAPEHPADPHEGATHDSKAKAGPAGAEPAPNEGAAKEPVPSDNAENQPAGEHKSSH